MTSKREGVSIIVISVIGCLVLAATPIQALAQQLLVVNKSSNSLSFVDPETRHETAVVSTGFAPHEVVVSSDGNTAYVTDYGNGQRPGNTITIVDIATARATGTISLGEHTRPHGISVASDGTLWVTTEGSSHVLQVDPDSRQVLQAIETGQRVTHMVVVAEEANRAFTANIGGGNVTAVDTKAGSVIEHITTGAGAEGIDLSHDGRLVYITNREAGTLCEIDVVTTRVLRTLEVGDFPIRVKLRPTGREALVSNGRGNEVVAVNLDSWEVVRRLDIGTMPIGIQITPDNRTAYVANTGDDKISVIDLVNWRLNGEIIAGDEPDGMAWVAAAPRSPSPRE
jgi:YVTN family beta-propeller protein